MGAWFSGMINMLMSGIIKFLCYVVWSVYNLILLLADINIFDNDTISAMKDKVFSLIALFMIFKLAFSIIQYIVNPDKLTDSTSGAQKLLVRIIVSIALLTVVDTAFEKAMEFQNIILNEGILNKIVFGESTKGNITVSSSKTSIEEADEDKKTIANFISYTLVSSFVDWNDEAFEDIINGETCETSPFIKIINTYEKTNINSLNNGKCYTAFVKEVGSSVTKEFKTALENYDIGKAISKIAKSKRNSEVMISLNFFTPLFLIIFIVVLVIIAVNVAVRSIKLSALMIIAPLPIISYIDPNEKDGLFKKWYKLLFKTYLDLFIQLLSFFFAVFLIVNVVGQNSLKGFSGNVYSIDKYHLLYIFMIIGIFLFAMQLPKLISDLTGAKTDGIAKGVKSGMGILGTTAVAGVGGAVGGMVAGWQHGNTIAGKFGHAIASGVTGSFGAQARGVWNGRKGGNIFANAGKAITASSVSRNANWVRDSNGRRVRSSIPFVSSAANSFGKMAGLKNSTIGVGRLKDDKKYVENALKDAQNALQDQMTARNDAFTRQVNAESEINRLRGQLNSKLNSFDGIDGGFNNSTGDFELKYNNQKMSIRDMNYTQFGMAMYENKSRIDSKRANGELDEQTYNRIMSNIDSLSHMSESEFGLYKNEISDLSNRLSSSRTVYENATADLNNVNNEINSIRSFIDNHQKKSNSISKDIDTLNKSFGK